MIPAQLDMSYGRLAAVVPLVTTFDSGSGNFTVLNYNTLTVEAWGGGAPGGNNSLAVPGNASSVSTLGMSASGGNFPPGTINTGTGGSGGTASGGNNTNSTGTAGTGTSPTNTGAGTSGAGGAGANGGAGGAARGTLGTGNPGTAPGGGGGGSNQSGDGLTFTKNPGGGGGGYSKSVYTRGVTSGAPLIGASLAYAVGALASASGQGDGAAGRVRFTVA